MEKYTSFYFHSVKFNIDILENILKSGVILSREGLNTSFDYIGFNGKKWISLCKYYDDEEYGIDYRLDSAYQTLIINGISLVLDNRIAAIKTHYMPYDWLYDELLDDDIRFSNCIDEYQVRDQVLREHFLAIMYPIRRTINSNNFHANMSRIKKVLCDYNYNIPIIDSSSDVIESELINLEKKLFRHD